jgi:hypothetical protein
MAKRVGQGLDNIFQRTTGALTKPPAKKKDRPARPTAAAVEEPATVATAGSTGRPRKHFERMASVSVLLADRHIVYLDRLSADVRSRSGNSIKRAEFIRAMIAALEESEIDLAAATSEDEVRRMLLQRLTA